MSRDADRLVVCSPPPIPLRYTKIPSTYDLQQMPGLGREKQWSYTGKLPGRKQGPDEQRRKKQKPSE